MIIQCMVRYSYIFSKKLPYQKNVMFKYNCVIEFVYVYQVTT